MEMMKFILSRLDLRDKLLSIQTDETLFVLPTFSYLIVCFWNSAWSYGDANKATPALL